MKYILIIVICFMGLATKAQVQKQGRSNFPTVVDSSLAIGKNFILPVFRSFSQLATYTNLDSSGRLVFIRDSNAVFYRDNAHQWVKFNSGSSGSAVWGSITGTLSNQTDLQTVLDSKVDSVILRGGDSLYNHYATGEVQFIGLLSGGSVSDTLIVTFPLYVNETNDTLSIPQASTDSSGYLSASDWNYFAVKPDSTVLNATGDTLLSYLGSTVIYSHAISGGGGGTNIGNSDLTITDDLRTLNLKTDGAFRVLGTGGSNDIEFKIDQATGTLSYPAVGGFFEVNKSTSPAVKIRTDAEIDSLRIGTTDKIGFPLHVAGDGTNTAVFMNGNVGIGATTPIAKLHIASTDTFALVVTGMGNSVVGTDSAVVRDIDGNFKVAAKSSGGGVSTAQLTDSLNARGATYLQVNNPSATGSFTLTSTTGGITNARVTTTQMNAISSPVAGMQVYNTDYKSTMTYSSDWGWTSDNTDWKIRNMIDYSNDFTGPLGSGTGSLSDGMLTTSVSNSGVVDTGQAVTVNRIGLVKLSTGTNASGQARIATGTGSILQTMSLGGGRIVLETAVYTNILPSAAERYSDILGFSSTNNNVSISNGVLFVYDSSGVVTGSTASPNWQVCTDSANTRTFSNTGVAVTANTWYNLKIIVNAARTSVDFYINDALVKTETRTIPISPVGIMLQRYKGGGTTARNLYVDYIRYKQKFTTSR